MKNRYSTNDANVQLVDKNFDPFEKQQFTLGVFIDLTNAFDTVDHSILLKKLKLYGITDENFSWFERYLSTRKQYIHIGENSKTDLITLSAISKKWSNTLKQFVGKWRLKG